jgi:hypothetical protein
MLHLLGASALLWLLSACGAPSEPAAVATQDAPPAAAGDTEELQAPDAGAENASVTAPAPAVEDVAAILQLVIDDPELDSHLHLGNAGRFPLQVAGASLPSGLKLVKAAEPVKVVAAPQSKKDAVLVFTEIEVQPAKATVRYRYDVEGIRGTATLAKTPHGWELKNSRLVEH